VTDPPLDWQVRVTVRDRGDVGVVKERLGAAGLRSIRRWRSLLLGARDEEEALEIARRVRELPLPTADVRVEHASRLWMALHAWFQGGGGFSC
jgi:hypothetical protein